MPNTTEYHWVFGRKSHIEFVNGLEPSIAPISKLNTDEGSASISDTSGNLLFYTDGSKLWDGAHNTVIASPPASLGGHKSTANSAVIIPPAGTRIYYHIIAANAWENPHGPITQTAVQVAGSTVAIVGSPAALASGPTDATEHLAAVPHANCRDYWVISTDNKTDEICVILIDGDTIPPPPANFKKYSYGKTAGGGWCMKASPSGGLLAFTNTHTKTNNNLPSVLPSIQIFSFDRTNGAVVFHSEISNIVAVGSGAYGIEFSPNESFLYYTEIRTNSVFRHTISDGSQGHSTSAVFGPFVSTISNGGGYKAGALQLGPNGKIYGVKTGYDTLFALETPDLPNPGFRETAQKAGGGDLVLNDNVWLGLPTFTRISTDCLDDDCSAIGGAVNDVLQAQQDAHINALKRCEQHQGTQGVMPAITVCAPLKMAPVKPTYHVTWGNSQCDCIESDDLEVMNLTICNPYSNITLSNLAVHKLEVVDAAGNPVATLPDGSPSITLVPIGPHCFDDIPPCTCVTREFTLRLRGAVSGPYKILVSGICYDICLHNDDSACFQFVVCED